MVFKVKHAKQARGSSTRPVKIASDITLSVMQHKHLVKHITERLDFGNTLRENAVEAYKLVDKEIAGFIKLDQDDTERQKDNIKGKGNKPVDSILPLAISQIDEAITFLLQVTAPDDGIYNAIAPAEMQAAGKAFSTLMNQHAADFKHYTNLARGYFDMLKYNFGGWTVNWVERKGNIVKNDRAKIRPVVESAVITTGNALVTIDPYNFIYDISVDPVNLATEGEFYAQVEIVTPFRTRKMEADGELYGIDRFINKTTFETAYYIARPTIRGVHEAKNNVDWVSTLTAGATAGAQESTGIELVTITAWVVPKKHGLSNSTAYEIWRFILAEGKYIVNATQITNAHANLPVAIAMPWHDGFGHQTKSYAELLLPYQRFSSFQLNTKQKADRKALYNLTVYDEDAIPDFANADMLGGKVPAKPRGGQDFDIRKHIAQFNDVPSTEHTLRDISAMDGLMQKVLPTDMLRQVTDLQRATQYQAAATVQGANRRNLKIAKLIDDQALAQTRFFQHYNILEFQDSMTMLGPDGKLVEINPGQFREAKLRFVISDGLRGLDKLMIVESMKEVLNAILQNQSANQRIDVVAVINYWTSMLGDNTDFTQFAYPDQFAALPPDQKQLAVQLLQQAQQPGADAGQQTQ